MTRPLKILIAEDEPDDVVLLRRAFSRATPDVAVQFARDGDEVVNTLQSILVEGAPEEAAAANQQIPTLLLLDLGMPRMSGFEVLRWLQSQPRLRQLHVIVFSASQDLSDMEHAYDLGADAYIVKPNDPDDFVDVIRGLEKHWLRPDATPVCGETQEIEASLAAGQGVTKQEPTLLSQRAFQNFTCS